MLAVCSLATNSLQMVLLACSLTFVVSTNAVLACPLLFYLLQSHFLLALVTLDVFLTKTTLLRRHFSCSPLVLAANVSGESVSYLLLASFVCVVLLVFRLSLIVHIGDMQQSSCCDVGSVFLCYKLVAHGVTCVFSRIRRVYQRRTCLSFAFLPVLVSFPACFGDT